MTGAPAFLSPLFYALGYLAGLAAFAWLAKKRGLATSGIWALMCAGVIGALAGANLVQLFVTGAPGKTLLGGVACGYLAVVLTKRYLGITRPTGDLFAVAIAAGEAIGRWGCFFGECCFGKPTHGGLTELQHGAERYPTQIFMSIAAAITFAILWRFEKKAPPENAMFFLQGALLCGSRFVIEFFREAPVFFAGLHLAQWACLAGAIFFGYRLYALYRVPATHISGAKAPALQTASA